MQATNELDNCEQSEDMEKISSYTILGDNNKFNKKKAVKRILPQWLLCPTIISSSLQNLDTKVSSVKELDKDLRKKLRTKNFKYFFPVQATVIPWLLKSIRLSSLIAPQDICVSAPTGSGKTLAFVLPVLQALKKYKIRKIRALVILPTQDLAAQVYKSFNSFTVDIGLHTFLLTANCAFESSNQHEESEISHLNSCDVLVCTPGRLVDYLNEANGFDLEQLKFLIIDEADRIMDNVQNNWLYHLEKHMQKYGDVLRSTTVANVITSKQKRVHKLLFSATLSVDPEKLQQLSLFQPKLFTCANSDLDDRKGEAFVGKFTFPSELQQKYIECKIDTKPLVLYKFIKQEGLRRVIVFTNSGESTKRLAILLQALFKKKLIVESVCSKLENSRRTLLIKDFSQGNVNIIVCTDSLARGIDLPIVECVISYSVPKYLKTYIHRVGRTARAGETGMSVTFVAPEKVDILKTLLKGQHIPEEIKISMDSLQTLEHKYEKALSKLTECIAREETDNLKKMMTAKKLKKKTANSKHIT